MESFSLTICSRPGEILLCNYIQFYIEFKNKVKPITEKTILNTLKLFILLIGTINFVNEWINC